MSSLLLILLTISISGTVARPVCKDADQCAQVQSLTSDADKSEGLITIGIHVQTSTDGKDVTKIKNDPVTLHFLSRTWSLPELNQLRFTFHVLIAAMLGMLAVLLVTFLVYLNTRARRLRETRAGCKTRSVPAQPMPDMSSIYVIPV